MRRRLTKAITLVAVASVALFALPLAALVHRSYRDAELLRLERDTIAATRRVDLAAQPGDAVELPGSRDALAVYGPDGHRVSGTGPVTGDRVVLTALRSNRPSDGAAGGRFVSAVPLVSGERVEGVLRASRGTAAVTRRVRRAWLGLLGLALAVVLIAAGAAVVVARRLSAPLETLADAARQLGDGDFAARAAPSGVHEVDAVADALQATGERLDRLISRERAFSADASHQLRTPLAALRMELEAMELERGGAQDVARALAQADRLQQTIDTLLAVARDDPRPRGTVDLSTAVEELRVVWHPRLAAVGRTLHIDGRHGPALAHASAAVVREILDVLLANAAQHGAGTVTLAVRDLGGWFAVDVGDDGSGVEDAEAVFERRGKSAAGHGIGLALARSLAAAEEGRLVLTRSAPAPIFTLLLPASAPA